MSGGARNRLGPVMPSAWQLAREAVDRAVAWPATFPILVGVASRVYSSVLLVIAEHFRTYQTLITNERSTFLAWDAQWYLRISQFGYHASSIQAGPNGGRHDFAFFPGWPGVMRGFELVGLDLGPAAVIAANLLAIAAIVVIFGVLERHFGRNAARGGIVLLAFAPASFILSMAYSEPLFLLTAGLYFASAGKPRQAFFAAATMLVRVTGLAIMASAVVAWLRNRRDPRPLLAGSAAAIVFAGWWVYLWVLTGNPTAWLNGSPTWFASLGPWAIAEAVEVVTIDDVGQLGITFGMLVAALLLVRRNAELGVYCVIAIAMTVLAAPVASMPRHTLVAFPVFGYLALRFGRRGTVVLAVLFAAMQFWFVGLTFTGQYPVPP
jgi:Mannosyltransferase (PIG-V)